MGKGINKNLHFMRKGINKNIMNDKHGYNNNHVRYFDISRSCMEGEKFIRKP